MRTIVLDTNCLLAILPSISPYHRVWEELLCGRVCLCVSNDILDELILNLLCVKKVIPTYYLHLIEADPDDNKFVDCAFCGEAELIRAGYRPARY